MVVRVVKKSTWRSKGTTVIDGVTLGGDSHPV